MDLVLTSIFLTFYCEKDVLSVNKVGTFYNPFKKIFSFLISFIVHIIKPEKPHVLFSIHMRGDDSCC